MDIHYVKLSTRRVKLRPFQENDIQSVIAWRNDTESMPLWTVRRAVISEQEAVAEFWEDLSRDKHVLLIAENNESKIVGMCYSYNANFIDEHCYVTVYVSPEYRVQRGYGIDLLAMFVDYLFSFFNFRKLYFETYEFGSSTKMWEKFGCDLEGTFREHRYFDGEWYSMYRFALYRNCLKQFREYLEKR